MSDSYKILFSRVAWKELMQFAENQQLRFFDAIESLEKNPRPAGCVKLRGEKDAYRIRVGDYRIVYEIRDAVLVVTVVRVRHRREVYRKQM